MAILINVLLVLWTLVALLMILIILMQRPKSEGLGAAFGGGVTENIFGAQTTNVLVKFTGYLAALFFVLTFVLSILYAKRSAGDSALRQELMKTQSGTAAATPGASASPGASAQASPGASAGFVPNASATPATSASVTSMPAGPSPATPAAPSVAPSASTSSQSPAASPASSPKQP